MSCMTRLLVCSTRRTSISPTPCLLPAPPQGPTVHLGASQAKSGCGIMHEDPTEHQAVATRARENVRDYVSGPEV